MEKMEPQNHEPTYDAKLRKELQDLGVSKYFIEQKDPINLHMAKKIVEEYDFGRELSTEEKKAIIQSILDNGELNKDGSGYLSRLIQALAHTGFEKQDIYGIIINLAVNEIALEEKGYGYSFLLTNTKNACKTIGEYKEKIQKRVNWTTILKAVSNNMSEQEEQLLKQELEKLGISREFIKIKDSRNLYIAKEIVEGYDFGRELSQEEKKAIIKAILANAKLNRGKHAYLSTLIQKLEKIGFEEQDIYGIIINLGVNGIVLEENGYSYSCLLGNRNNACETIGQFKTKIDRRVNGTTILTAVSNNMSEQEEQELKEELEGLGISREFIEQKDPKNLCMAKMIVESYNFGKELSQEEKKSIIRAILANSQLDRGKYTYLSTLMQSLEKIGLEEQEVYAIIINLGVNGRVVEESGYAYEYLLTNVNNACKTIGQFKNKIDRRVNRTTILTAVSNDMNEQEEQELKEELDRLGISRELIEQKDSKNLCMAKMIVENYNLGRELSQEEKKSIIQAILANPQLDRGKRAYLATLMQKLEKIGLEEQEVYATIINLGVNGRVVEKNGYSYDCLLKNNNNACETIRQYKTEIDRRVNGITILTAVSNNMNEQKEQLLKQELEGLGISREFIEQKAANNLYVAQRIVESYDFGRELSIEEKKSIIKAILNNSTLNKGGRSCISILMKRLQDMGLDEQKTYGVIINLGVNGFVLKGTRHGYTDLLVNRNNACKTIADYRDAIQTEVTEETIGNSIKKAEKIMRRAAQRRKKVMGEQAETRSALGCLVKLENIKDENGIGK